MALVSDLVRDARSARRDQLATNAARAAYRAAFERLERLARELRAEGWAEGAEIVQRKAEIAYRAARAEHLTTEGAP